MEQTIVSRLHVQVKLQLHDAIYRLRFYSNSLTHILLLSSSHNNVASIQKNRGDKSHRVIVALDLWANSVLVAAYHGSAIRMEHFALSVNNTLKA